MPGDERLSESFDPGADIRAPSTAYTHLVRSG